MSHPIQIRDKDREILQKILLQYPYTFYVYGSRAKGQSKTFSDIDLCCLEEINPQDMANLRCDLDESGLSIKVDITAANTCTPQFFDLIRKDLVPFS